MILIFPFSIFLTCLIVVQIINPGVPIKLLQLSERFFFYLCKEAQIKKVVETAGEIGGTVRVVKKPAITKRRAGRKHDKQVENGG